ncbi:DUF502 domain-containing protein [Nafulsella turpanensis]|uniref:DUF502 domain-containing protein n=1 Tax=Nafulsella turpanensis TaxID=1265690 RepID=UPI0003484E2F|nr:DUF502 domain-containing protein [Nafulsella turpanensis]
MLVPIALTVYIIIVSLQWLDSLLPVPVPGLGLVLIIGIIVLFGYLASSLIARPVFEMMEEVLMRVPLISLIYSSIKDLLSAFVGDKKKFTQAVLVTLNEADGVQKLGFITQTNLEVLGEAGKVAVYLPHSYNFSGNLYIVAKERVTLLNVPGADVMKFIVSGGVSGYTELGLAKETRDNQLKQRELTKID